MPAGGYTADDRHSGVGQTLAPVGTSAVRQLSQLGIRAAQVRPTRTKLDERALPSAGEIQIKVEAGERMVARGPGGWPEGYIQLVNGNGVCLGVQNRSTSQGTNIQVGAWMGAPTSTGPGSTARSSGRPGW